MQTQKRSLPKKKLMPCPFCDARMRVRKHSAFHPASKECFLSSIGENGSPLELADYEYDTWNRRNDQRSKMKKPVEKSN